MGLIISITIASVTIWLVIAKYRNYYQNYKQSNIESLRTEASVRCPSLLPADQMHALYRYRIKEIIMLRKFDQDTEKLEDDLWCIINEINRLIAQEVEEMSEMEVQRFDEGNESATETIRESPLILRTASSIQ